MRVSVQLRYPGSGGGRWRRSVFVDEGSATDIDVPVAGLRPADNQSSGVPEDSGAVTLLFVIDLTNARPGDAGRFEISGLRFLR